MAQVEFSTRPNTDGQVEQDKTTSNTVAPNDKTENATSTSTKNGENIPAMTDVTPITVSFLKKIWLLLIKNFKQQAKRKIFPWLSKILLPMVFMVILIAIRSIPSLTDDVDVHYGGTDPSFSSFYTSTVNFIPSTLCIVPDWGQGSVGYENNLPGLLAIVPNPYTSNNTHLLRLMELLNSSFVNGLSYYNYANQTNFVNNCTLEGSCMCEALTLSFSEGSLLAFFDTQDDLDEYVSDPHYADEGYVIESQYNGDYDSVKSLRPIGSAIVFTKISDDGLEWEYIIRQNSSIVPDTSKKVDKFTKDYDTVIDSIDKYAYRSGFVYLQDWIDVNIMKYVNEIENNGDNNTLNYIDNLTKGFFVFPAAAWQSDTFWPNLSNIFPFFMLIMFVYPFAQAVADLVEEKASKIKEGMKMMGATLATFWISWYIWFLFEFTLIAFGTWVVAMAGDVFRWSDSGIIFLWLWLFCLNMASLATLVSTFFDNPKTAAMISTVFFIVTIFGGNYATALDEGEKTGLCFLGPSCFTVSLNNLVQYEAGFLGLQWNNIYETYENFKFNTCLVMLFIDTVIYVLLTIYLDQALPSRYGQHLPPWFFLTSDYWKSCFGIKNNTNEPNLAEPLGNMFHDNKNYEKLDLQKEEQQPVIRIRNFTKTFQAVCSTEEVYAVQGTNMDIYQGEVFCLLGHNGAGKTTTISMLTGLIEITRGDAWILGKNISTNMDEVRQSMGICPQHDVLWPRLTCREHLELFARLKGCPEEHVASQVEETLKITHLTELEHNFPPFMSGGEKRKLSLGIALIGGSKVVFLDEPTSGMDPQARRITWDVIEREKKGRCIILTTHYMDEADILGDRIAIMAGGKIQCCGSALFLKRLYGVGYTFTVSLNAGVQPSHVKPEVDNVVLKQISGSSVVAVAGAEITYRLPFEQTSAFPQMFDSLDQVKEKLQLSSYGISVTTLEEVFLKIGHDHPDDIAAADIDEAGPTTPSNENADANANMSESQAPLKTNDTNGNDNNEKKDASSDDDDNQEKKQENISNNNNNDDDDDDGFQVSSFALVKRGSGTINKIIYEIVVFFKHFYAILYRRFWWSIRDYKSLCFQLVLPGFLSAVGLGILQLDFVKNYPLIYLDASTQWYDANSLIVPVANYTDINELEPSINDFDTNNSWINSYNNYLEENYGSFVYYSMEPTSNYTNYDSTLWINDTLKSFADELLSHASDSSKIHYNAWMFPPIAEDWFMVGANASAYHSLPIAWNQLSNWILKNKISSSASIKVYNHPLSATTRENAFETQISGFFASIFLVMAFAFLPGAAIYNIVNERKCLTKHQQLVSGISSLSYWTANYFWDVVAALPAAFLVWIELYIFDVDSFKGGEEEGCFVLTIILFIWAIIPFTYLISFLFSAPERAQTITATAYVLLGAILGLVSFVLDLIDSTKEGNKIGKPFYRILPTFLMSETLFSISLKPLTYADKSYYAWGITGRNFVFLFIEGVGYFLLILIVDYISRSAYLMKRLGFIYDIDDNYKQELDIDVANEKKRVKDMVQSLAPKQFPDSVVINGIRKVYSPQSRGLPPKIAVRDLCFGIPQGQVFGFLGVNGAGKTTTLACLTGERFVSSGNAFIKGKSIANQTAVRRYIGYCPQFDALFDLLTAKEHLKFYGMLKGLKGKEMESQVDMLLKALSLNKYANRQAGTYSGGNKRKLSAAIAMIGNPPVVFMDEPSTGMDPVSRRHMWKFISKTMTGRAVILTTHSMEECEALCHKLAIMVNGELSCLGTPQHLKSRFGKGYQLDITLTDGAPSVVNDLTSQLSNYFIANIIEHNRSKVTYEIQNKDENHPSKLSDMFRILEHLKTILPIVSYALNQTTLEQIFIKMAKQGDHQNANLLE